MTPSTVEHNYRLVDSCSAPNLSKSRKKLAQLTVLRNRFFMPVLWQDRYSTIACRDLDSCSFWGRLLLKRMDCRELTGLICFPSGSCRVKAILSLRSFPTFSWPNTAYYQCVDSDCMSTSLSPVRVNGSNPSDFACQRLLLLYWLLSRLFSGEPVMLRVLVIWETNRSIMYR